MATGPHPLPYILAFEEHLIATTMYFEPRSTPRGGQVISSRNLLRPPGFSESFPISAISAWIETTMSWSAHIPSHRVNLAVPAGGYCHYREPFDIHPSKHLPDRRLTSRQIHSTLQVKKYRCC